MGKKRPRYSAEFKAEAVKLITEQGYTQTEASASLGINSNNLSRWILQAQSSGNKGTSKLTAEQAELNTLRQEIKRLKMEREILKKAAAFFANESS